MVLRWSITEGIRWSPSKQGFARRWCSNNKPKWLCRARITKIESHAFFGRYYEQGASINLSKSKTFCMVFILEIPSCYAQLRIRPSNRLFPYSGTTILSELAPSLEHFHWREKFTASGCCGLGHFISRIYPNKVSLCAAPKIESGQVLSVLPGSEKQLWPYQQNLHAQQRCSEQIIKWKICVAYSQRKQPFYAHFSNVPGQGFGKEVISSAPKLTFIMVCMVCSLPSVEATVFQKFRQQFSNFYRVGHVSKWIPMTFLLVECDRKKHAISWSFP